MNRAPMPIEVTHLTKRFGEVSAVHDLTFTIEPGVVTGFLGPNGAGKSTTLRMLAGLVAPTSGTATIGGRRYGRLTRPSSTVGAVFDANAAHPGHTGRAHLRVYAAMARLPDSRVTAVIEMLGLTDFADRRTRGYSTGMHQRLSLATAMLGDPQVLLLDEPSNGLDPEGMRWLRRLLRQFATEGRTIVISSHVLSEIQQLADDVVVIHRGQLLATGPWRDLAQPPAILVTSPDDDRLASALALHSKGQGAPVIEAIGSNQLRVRGLSAPEVADAAAAHGLRVHGLTSEDASLEQLFLHLTAEKVLKP